MQNHRLIALLLAAGMLSGCVVVQIGSDSKPKHHHGQESGDREEEREDEDAKDAKHGDREERGERGEREEKQDRGAKKEKEDAKDSQAKLKAKAKVSEAKARELALAKVPGGKVKEGGLEMENGKLIWSFDIATAGSKDITEVAVDAITGEVLAVATETPEQQAKEKEEDAKEAKKKGDRD